MVKIMKCPRCDLNYIREGEKVCRVCARELKLGLSATDDTEEICAACGERPALPGKDLCAKCLRDREELKKDDDLEAFGDETDDLDEDIGSEDSVEFGDSQLETTSLSEMEEEEYNADDEEDEY